MTIENICRAFGIQGELVNERQLKTGNINGTYKMTFRTAEGDADYIVQRVNTYVFHDPVCMMENIAAVTTHIAKKLETDPARDRERGVLRFLCTAEGKYYYIDEESGFWRSYRFIPNSVTYDSVEDLTVLRNAGAAFGQFQQDLSDFDASALTETIPDFHNTPKRLETLFRDAEKDPCGRAGEAAEELAYLRQSAEKAGRPVRLSQSGELPLRVVHNDTKGNNILFDSESGEALAVIDLDTVMPGLIMYDFGDAVRFAANTAAEDEPDLSKVGLDLGRFTAFTEGFVGALGGSISAAEADNMALGAYAVTVELASRFLDDYLTGDKYFAVHYPGHNLVRARSQIALAKDIERRLPELDGIVKSVYSSNC